MHVCCCEGAESCRPCGGTGDYDPDSFSKKVWAEVPETIRQDVGQYVAAHLSADLLGRLHDLHAHGDPISRDDAFFHFGGGLTVRNLCRKRLSDDELAACGFFGADWDSGYIAVLCSIAATRQ